MIIELDVECSECGCSRLIPVIYGVKQPKRDFDLQLAFKLKINPRFAYHFGGPLWACEECLEDILVPGTRIGEGSHEFHEKRLNSVFAEPAYLDDALRKLHVGKFELLSMLLYLKARPETYFEMVADEQNSVQVYAIDSSRIPIIAYEYGEYQQLLRYCNKPMVLFRRTLTWHIDTDHDSGEVPKLCLKNVLEKLPEAFDLDGAMGI